MPRGPWSRPEAWRALQIWAVVSYPLVLPIGKSLAEAALVIGVGAWIMRSMLGPSPRHLLRHPLSVVFVAWALVALCSMTNSIAIGASLDGLRKLLKHVLLFTIVMEGLEEPRHLRWVMGGIFIGLLIVSVDGLWQWYVGTDLLFGKPLSFTLDGVVPRIQATFNHPASLAIYLGGFLPLVLAVAMQEQGRHRSLLFGLFGVAMVVLVLSRTRGGFLGFVASLVYLTWALRRWAPLALAAVVVGLQALTTPPAVREWAATMPSLLHQLTQPERLMYWQAALNMIQAHPIIGVGTNTFVLAYPQYRIASDHFATIGPYAHNQYLHVTAELGVLGLVVFTWLLVLVFRTVHRALRAERARVPYESAVIAGVGGGLVGYLVMGVFESSWFYSRGALIFWFLVGMVMAADRFRQRAGPSVGV